MRHIPEAELHAYLDQALSRSQAVEIERHLARCHSCQAHRDGIAALRDRTTDLLARLGSPPSVLPPPFEELRARHRLAAARRLRWVRAGSLAAGVVGVLLVGRALLVPGDRPPEVGVTAPPIIAASPPEVAPPVAPPLSPASSPVSRAPARALPVERQLVRRTAPGEAPSFAFARTVETDPGALPTGLETTPMMEPAHSATAIQDADVQAAPVSAEPGLSGLWRTVALDHGTPPSADLPLVPGLSVVRMRMQPGANGAEVVAVDQVLESGEMVRTISGPAGRVGALVAQEASADSGVGRVTFTIRQADRMVAVTGPADVLSSLLSRVNGRRRY